MIDDNEARPSPRDHAGSDRYGETLLYDFAKFVTTIALLTLGGVVSVIQSAPRGDIKTGNIVMITVAIGASAAIAFISAHMLADARARGDEPHPRLAKSISVSIALLAIGLGGFLMMWIDSLS